MTVIKVNCNDIQNTISCYQASIDILEQNMKTLEQKLLNLRNEWKGDAKEAFFNNIYVNFKNSIQADINHIRFLKQQLEMTKNEFIAVENKYKNLKL